MTEHDNILRLAREAGLNTWVHTPPKHEVEAWMKFAALVKAEAVAETLDACSKVCLEAVDDGERKLIFMVKPRNIFSILFGLNASRISSAVSQQITALRLSNKFQGMKFSANREGEG